MKTITTGLPRLSVSEAPQEAIRTRPVGPHFAPGATDASPAELRPPASSPVEWDVWDDGRLIVNRDFTRVFADRGLTGFTAWFDFDEGDVVRRVGTRETRRISFDTPDGPVTFYLKRHGRPRWRDRIMPWLHGARPIHGARNEWEAIRRFIAAGLPTMTPVAFGAAEGRSLLMTQALPAFCDLLEFVGGREPGSSLGKRDLSAEGRDGTGPASAVGFSRRELLNRVVDITRRMHAAGLHHQDFYLNHLLLCDADGQPDIRVIDLGRVQWRSQLALRWIIKDLAQLNFSAGRVSTRDRLRFLRLYLGRSFRPEDRALVQRIVRKSQRIAAHTTKHDL